MPLSDAEVVTVEAVLKGNGVREGIDHRGVPVSAASRKVEGTDWHVIAQTDTAEALVPLRRRRAGGRVIGALTIHAAQAFAFNREEVAFLVQFAADISYGIDKLVRVPPRQ